MFKPYSNTFSLYLLILSVTVFALPGNLYAGSGKKSESKGEITSAPCPYSCRSKGLKKKKCRDWKEGDKCFVEDLTKKAKKKKKKK